MQFIRYQTENRTLLSILFVSFLCLSLISVSSFIYAVGPLLIFGVPAAILVKKTVTIGLTALTVWGGAELIHKDFDEKIAVLQDDIKRLTITKQNAKTVKDSAETEAEEWKEKYEAAEKAIPTANTNLETAKTAVTTAQTAYDTAVDEEYQAYNDWRLDCLRSSGNYREQKRLYNKWQAAIKTMKDKKTALDNAQANVVTKTRAVSDAWDNYYTVGGTYGQYKLAAELATNLFKSAKAALDKKVADLTSMLVEKTINSATIQDAVGQTEWAIYTLETAETNFPEAWSEAMEDPDLAAQVKEVRDKWNAKTGNGGQ